MNKLLDSDWLRAVPFKCDIGGLKKIRFWAANVNRKFMFLLLARFHVRPMSYKALILAFTTWLFEWKGLNTYQRGEVSTSGWRPWLETSVLKLRKKCFWSYTRAKSVNLLQFTHRNSGLYVWLEDTKKFSKPMISREMMMKFCAKTLKKVLTNE